PLGLTPAVIGLFEQDGDLFLAQELVDAVPLRLWVRQQAGVIGPDTGAAPGVGWTSLVETMTGLIDLTGAVHRAGWVIRDLTPTNVMLTPQGPRLVDLEFAARPGEAGPAGGTPGYVAPEQ